MLRIHATRPHPYPPEALYFLIPHIVATVGNTPADYRFEANGRLPSGETFSFAVTPLIEEIGEETALAIETALATHATFAVNVTKSEILPNGTDESALSITGQTAFTFTYYKDNLPAGGGVVNDGVLEFSADAEAIYIFELKVGNQTGYATVEATNG